MNKHYEVSKNPHQAIEDRIDTIISLYPLNENETHGQKHIRSCLKNLTAIKKSAFGLTITDQELNKAKLAIVFHDIDRNIAHFSNTNLITDQKDGVTAYIKEQLADLSMSDKDIKDIVLAVQNHNKPKEQWHEPNHLTSSLLYDADKMDIKKRRFFLDTKDEQNANKFYGYIIMVRDSLTSNVAIEKINSQLPKDLRINPNDQTKTAEEVKKYYEKMHQIWEESTLPAKKTVAKYCLQCTANINYTNSIKDSLGERPNIELLKLSPLRRRLIDRIEEMEKFTKQALSDLDILLSNIGKESSKFSRDQLFSGLSEKLFMYDMFIRALIKYPEQWENDLERMYFRKQKNLHKNYEEIKSRIHPDIMQLGERFQERKVYFNQLVNNQLNKINHYTRDRDFISLISARRIIEKEIRTILDGSESVNLNLAIEKAIENKGAKASYDILRFFSQVSLRAVDRVNDLFGTNRYIYFLLENQVTNAPVRRLPYIYSMNIDSIKNMQIIFSHPSHPQAIHLMKMHSSPYNTPEILAKSIRLFSHGLLTKEDFRNLYTDILALNFDTVDIDKETLDFIFENVVVNEESALIENKLGTFSAPDWLEVDYQKRSNPLWKKANKIVTKINEFCMSKGIIPPLRPYVIIPKELELGTNCEVINNPILETTN